MGKFKTLCNKGVGMLKNVKTYWKKPMPGYYLGFKEVFAYCVGGMGVVGATVVPVFVTLAAGMYTAAALGIENEHLIYIGIATSIFTIIKSPICSWLVDNTQSKYGKFRPYLIWMPIPIIVCMVLLGNIPQLLIDNYVAMVVSYTIIFNLLQFFMGLYGLAYTTLVQVISPSQKEKELLMSFGSVVYSLGPSIVNFLFPLLANLIYTTEAPAIIDGIQKMVEVKGVNTIGPYQWILPLITAIFLGLGYLTAFGTKERIVISKQYVQKVKFTEGIKLTFQNRYFWITNIAGAIGAMKLWGTTFIVWICSYLIQGSFGKVAQPIFITLMGSACLPGMLLAPILIRKFGKKNLTIFSNIFTLVLTGIMAMLCLPQFRNDASAYIMILFSFLITMVNSVQVVTNPALGTQMYDYQQYKTGIRLEGFLSQFGAIIVTAVGIGISFIQPSIYIAFGFDGKNSTVLTDPNVIYPIIMTCCWVAVGSGIAGTIPFFFWKLTEKRHEDIIEILKVRAAKDDNLIEKDVADKIETALENGNSNALRQYEEYKAKEARAPKQKFMVSPEAEKLYQEMYS